MSKWLTIKPLTTAEAVTELADTLYEALEGDLKSEALTKRLTDIIDGIYLRGWQDRDEVWRRFFADRFGIEL